MTAREMLPSLQQDHDLAKGEASKWRTVAQWSLSYITLSPPCLWKRDRRRFPIGNKSQIEVSGETVIPVLPLASHRAASFMTAIWLGSKYETCNYKTLYPVQYGIRRSVSKNTMTEDIVIDNVENRSNRDKSGLV